MEFYHSFWVVVIVTYLRHRLSRLAPLFLAALILCAHTARARADYFDLAPEDLLNAQVSSVSKRAEPLSTAPAAVYIITRDDIEHAGVTTIADALRMAPGVDVAQTDSNSWAISIRGFNSTLANKLLVMIDGRTVYNPAFAGTFWEIQDLVLDDIDRIEVVRGPGGTLWGANAVNGVINIIMRNASETVGNYLQAGYGNIEQGFASARHGGQFDDGGYYRVYAKGFNRSGFEGSGSRNGSDDWSGGRTGFRADWDSFTLEGDIYDTDTHERDFIPNFTAPAFGTSLVNELDYRGGDLLGRWKHETATGGLFTLQSYVDYTARLWPQEIDDRRLTLDFEPQYNLAPHGRHEVVVGGDYRFMSMNETISRTFALTPPQQNNNLFSAFIQDKITLATEWFLTLGTKLEHNDFSGFEVEPSVRLAWTPDAIQTAWAAVSRAVRTPTPIEQNATVVLQDAAGSQVALLPNPDFGSEDLVAYELGYRRQMAPNLSMNSTIFFNDYSHLTNTHLGAPVLVNNGIDPPFLQFPAEFTNSMNGETWGFELGADWKVTPNWKLAGSFSHLEMYLHSHDNTIANQEAAEGSSPQNEFNIRSSWKVTDNWTVDTSLYHVGDLTTGDISPYTRLDLNIGYRITDNLTANLVGQNLVEDHHREIQGGTYIPRSVFGYLTWRF